MQPAKPAARCSRPLCSSQSTGGTLNHPQPTARNSKRSRRPSPTPHLRRDQAGSGPSGPNSVQERHPTPTPFLPPEGDVLREGIILRTMSNVPPMSSPQNTNGSGRGSVTPEDVQLLLRKEVIQPHLPVRLPCYDLVLITDPTFDSSLPQGVRPPASGVTDFHDLTGGVYKTRERIHRSVADLRLLATPTS